jgi:hypothetical protein
MTKEEKKERIKEIQFVILQLKKTNRDVTIETKLTIQKLQQEIGDIES